MKSLILTKEQKAMRAYEARHSEAGQLATFERSVRRAMDGVSEDIAAEHGQASFTAAMGGLLNVVVEQLAMLPDDDRARFVRAVQAELPQKVDARVAMAMRSEGRG